MRILTEAETRLVVNIRYNHDLIEAETDDQTIVEEAGSFCEYLEEYFSEKASALVVARELEAIRTIKRAAAVLGKRGGKSKSPAKIKASRKSIKHARGFIDKESHRKAVIASNRRRARINAEKAKQRKE